MGMETGNGVKEDAKIGKMEQNEDGDGGGNGDRDEDGKWSERGYEDRVDGVKWRRE